MQHSKICTHNKHENKRSGQTPDEPPGHSSPLYKNNQKDVVTRPSFFDQKVLSAKTGTLRMIHTEDIIPKGGRTGPPVQTKS